MKIMTMLNSIMQNTTDLATSSEKKRKEFLALDRQYNTQNIFGHFHFKPWSMWLIIIFNLTLLNRKLKILLSSEKCCGDNNHLFECHENPIVCGCQ